MKRHRPKVSIVAAKLVDVALSTEKGSSKAHVKIDLGGNVREEVALGEGPVGAAMKAIGIALGMKGEVAGRCEFEGSVLEPSAKATVEVLIAGYPASRTRRDRDPVMATLKAYVAALNAVAWQMELDRVNGRGVAA